LTALIHQSKAPEQVIVVRRDEDRETQEFLDGFGASLPLTVCEVRVPGQVAALNAALDRVRGDIVAITDDDAAPRPDWVEKIGEHFAARPEIGGLGGRDFQPGVTQGESERVGMFEWFGRIGGNHHVGKGGPRFVHYLKGANMSYRMAALSDIRFDARLRGVGAQVRNDFMISLQVSRKGWRLLYDPAVAVDHYPAPRFDGDARNERSLNAIYDAAFNETLAVLEHFPRPKRLLYWAFSLGFGSRDLPGIGQCLRLSRKRPGIWRRLPYVVRGRLAARNFARRPTTDAETRTIAARRMPASSSPKD
jgi:glycosyltransferase involved in cell wall biosynthesis